MLRAGILLGCALSTKMISGSAFPALLIVMFWNFRNWHKKELYRILIFSLSILIILGCIPYIRAYLIAGNPVFPFFNQIFKSSYYQIVNFNNSLYNSGSSWDMIYRMTFDSGHYLESTAGAPGFRFARLSATRKRLHCWRYPLILKDSLKIFSNNL